MHRAALFIAATVALMACAPEAKSQAKKDAPGDSARSTSGAAAQSGPSAAPEAKGPQIRGAAALAPLGLTLFAEPQPVPAFALKTPEGKTLSIADFKGKYVFLNFWATWCPPCREEMPSMQDLQAKFGKDNFSILAVSVREDPKTVSNFLKQTPYAFPIVLDPDGSVSSIFVGRGIPTTYILDDQGRAIAGMVGSRQWNTPEVYAAFAELIGK